MGYFGQNLLYLFASQFYIFQVLVVRHLFSEFQLVLDQMIVISFVLYQFSMVANFYNLALVQDHDLMGILNSAQPVCNDHYRFILKKSIEFFHDGFFIVGIQRRGSLIKKQKVWI